MCEVSRLRGVSIFFLSVDMLSRVPRLLRLVGILNLHPTGGSMKDYKL